MNGLFKLNLSDFQKGLVMAVLGGIFLPIAAAVQTPDFNIATVDLRAVVVMALNGGIVSFVTYMTKNFFSTSDGKFGGKIG